MAELLARLTSALADRYAIEREIGRGGMATVYLARDLRHDRLVAIKVLQPELGASLGAERFLREIRTAARLQHPHVLTVLDSGEAGGLLWYSMPYVEGESLRGRLERGGALPVPEAVRLMREVADALAYAHRQSVVHRDIKPENVLLSNGHALVTDFGVAKAVSGAAEAGAARTAANTSAGVALGTPTYMSPEQASADPHVDRRADIYSLGVMAYELLAGEPPIGGATAQQVLAAQVTRAPEPILARRPNLPPALADAVMRCLEKLPADRFQSADELGAVLQEMSLTPSQGTQPVRAVRRRKRRPFFLIGGGVAVLGGAVVALRGTGALGANLVAQGVLDRQAKILVADFRSPGDSTLGQALTEAFRVDLGQQSAIQVVQPERVRQVLDRMQRPPDTKLDADAAREVAERDGARAIVLGDVARVGRGYSLSARLIAAGTGDELVSLRETADDDSKVLAALERLSRQMRRRIGGSVLRLKDGPGLEQVTTGSLDALKKYSQAQVIARSGNDDATIPLLRQATQLDTSFAMAWRKLGIALRNNGYDKSLWMDALTRAYRNRDRLTELERNVTEGSYYQFMGDRPRAVSAYRAALDLAPTNQIASINLGMLLSRRRATRPEAITALRRLLATDSTNVRALSMLAQAYAADGQLDSMEHIIPRISAAESGSFFAEGLTEELMTARQRYDSAIAYARDKRRSHAGDAAAVSNYQQVEGALLSVVGRMAAAESVSAESQRNEERAGRARQARSVALTRAIYRVIVADDNLGAMRILDSVAQPATLQRLPPPDRLYDMLAGGYAMAGRPDRARAVMAEAARLSPDVVRQDSMDYLFSTALTLVAEHKGDQAIPLIQQYGSAICDDCIMADLGNAFDQAGRRDSAIVAYQRFLDSPDSGGDIWLLPFRGRAAYRVAELHDERGDRPEAAAAYQRFIDLWRNADPQLQPRVQEARKRLAALQSDRP